MSETALVMAFDCDEAMQEKVCVICGAVFVPRKAWATTCSKECSTSLNARRNKARRVGRPEGAVERVVPEPTDKVTDEMLTPEAMTRLVAGLFENARRMKDAAWLHRRDAQPYLDAAGTDAEQVMAAWGVEE